MASRAEGIHRRRGAAVLSGRVAGVRETQMRAVTERAVEERAEVCILRAIRILRVLDRSHK